MPSPAGPAETIGKYQVIRPVDEARGFGAGVYLADDPDAAIDERAFLIKLLDVRGLERAKALRELRQVRGLEHAAGATLIDHFEHGRQLAVVLEAAEGLWLDEVMDGLEQRSERLPLAAIWHLGAQVAGALAAAHAQTDDQGRPQHIAHGGLGPDHIHVAWSGAVRVYGIGLEAVLGSAERGARARGTLAPERQRKGLMPGAQADVFGLGAVLWSLLSGGAAAPGEPLAKVAAVRDGVPEEVAAAIDGAVQRALSARRINCAQLAERLGDAVRGDGQDELRQTVERLGSSPSSDAAADGPRSAPGQGEGAEQSPPSSPPAAARSSDKAKAEPGARQPEARRSPTSGPKGRKQRTESLAQRIGARKPAPRGPAATDEAPKPAGSAPGSDPPEQGRKPGPGSLPPVHDESVVERISSLFDDIETAGASPTAPVTPEGEASTPPEEAPATDDDLLPVAVSSGSAGAARPAGGDGEDDDLLPAVPDGDPPPPPEALDDLPVVKERSEAPLAPDAAPPGGDEEKALAASSPALPPAPRESGRRGISPVIAALLALATGAAGFAAAWILKPDTVVTTMPSRTAPRPSPAPSAAPAPSLATTTGPSAKPPASAAPSAAAAAPVPGSDAGGLPPVAEALDAGDGSELLSYEGYLTVRSPATADVYVQGIHVGTTNQKLKSRCRQRFVRLRDPGSGQWLTRGDPVRITCMGSTTVTITPPAR